MPKLGPTIERLSVGQLIERVPVVVVEASAGKTRNGDPFARYVFRDRTATINGIRWSHALEENVVGSAALVTGSVDEYQGAKQLRVADLAILAEPSAEVVERLQQADDPDRRERLVAVLEAARRDLPPVFWELFCDSLGHDPFDLEAPFWTFAAAQSRHHAGRGGLAWHVLTMYAHIDALVPHYPGLDVDLAKLAVLTHDLGKLDCYEMGAIGARQLSSDRTIGHSAYSLARVHEAIVRLRAKGDEFSAADEENLLHCIASHHGRLEWGAMKEPQTAEAHLLHALDVLDSQLRGELDRRREAPPQRATGPAPAAAEPPALSDEEEHDPFLADDDDPFDDEAVDDDRPGGVQPSLFGE